MEVAISIGKNAKNNWQLFEDAHQNHTWFHLDGLPSPYVIVNQKIDQLDKKTITEVALLCKKNSKYKDYNKVTIIYTSIKNLEKGSKVGEVRIKSSGQCKRIKI